jgi:predicted metal-binding membrane protein
VTNSDAALAALLRRDRAIVLAALALLAAAAWLYVLSLAASMNGHSSDMGSMNAGGMVAAMAPQFAPWSLAHALFVLVMWTVMMVGMMTPSAAAMVLTYAAVARQAESRGTPFAPAVWFVCGYLSAWTAFALLATTGQWVLERLSLLTPMMASASTRLGGVLLIAVGIYQWTPLKNVCLENCRAPLSFVQRHGGFKANAGGSLRLGLLHGLYCVGCCWALMALLFVGGVMNTLWIVALTVVVLAEKLFPYGRLVAKSVGVAAFTAGLWLLVGT